ncbi:MAG TPA: response regulator [Candidatus Binataceae bacterium]|nr:response regulator [Candidatus Binataceae bacterium]
MDLLLVEDSATDRMVMQRRIQHAFPADQVLIVGEGFEFNEILRRENIDVVITDYWLGWGDGLSVLQRVRKRWPRCKVIFLTGNGGEEVVAEAFKYGLFYYMLKPDGFENLVTVIQTALETKRHEDHCAMLTSMVNAMAEGIHGIDAAGKITTWNASSERIYGYRGSEIIGEQAEVLVPANLRVETRRLYARALRGEVIAPFETTRLRSDGARLALLLSIAPVRMDGREISGIVIVTREAGEARVAPHDPKAVDRAAAR